jgi:hypothetical protein
VEGGLRKWSISLYGSSVRGSWRGFLTGDPEVYVKNSLEKGISLYGVPVLKPGRGLIYQRLMFMRRLWR